MSITPARAFASIAPPTCGGRSCRSGALRIRGEGYPAERRNFPPHSLLAANVTLARRTTLLAAALALGAAALPPAAQATHRPRPHLKQIRCVPAAKCKTTPTAVIGDQVRFIGTGLYHGMRI